jgi:TolB-like protein/Flp pilus assembly protein TadD
LSEHDDQPAERPERYEFDDVVVDPESYRVLKAGRARHLGPRPFDLLLELLRHPGRVLGKQELFDRVWRGVIVTDNALTRAIKDLRDAIGDDARAPRYVETVARRGYRFVAPVTPAASPVKLVLAVLPFSDLSRDPQEYFCDGLTEELITQIAHLNPERLRVIARTSAMMYRNTTLPISEIARELGVACVLEGSVRREGGRVRISAQLIDARDQTHLWADSFEEDLSDILRAQRQLADAVTRAVRVELGPGIEPRRDASSIDPEAYAAHLEGRYFWNRRTGDAIERARSAFERAVSREPTYAPAHASLARCHMVFTWGLRPRFDAEPMAEAAVRTALDLDYRLAEAHTTLGALQAIARDYSAAERTFRQALTLSPNDPTVHHWHAMLFLVALGRFEEALSELRRAQALDPLALIFAADAAAVLCLMREPDKAIEQCHRVLGLDPTFARAHFYAGWAHAQQDELRDALTALEKACELDDNPWTAGWLGYACGRAGRESDAERLLDRLRELSDRGCEVAFFTSLVQTGMGDLESALASLAVAREERAIGFDIARYTFAFDCLREDPRFQRLLQVGGPES